MKITKDLSREHRLKLLNALSVPHSHSEMTQWAKCVTCQEKMMEYRTMKAKMPVQERDKLNQEVFNKATKIFEKMKAKGFIPAQ